MLLRYMLSPKTATMQESKFLSNSSGKGFINYLRTGRKQEPDQRGPQERDGHSSALLKGKAESRKDSSRYNCRSFIGE